MGDGWSDWTVLITGLPEILLYTSPITLPLCFWVVVKAQECYHSADARTERRQLIDDGATSSSACEMGDARNGRPNRSTSLSTNQSTNASTNPSINTPASRSTSIIRDSGESGAPATQRRGSLSSRRAGSPTKRASRGSSTRNCRNSTSNADHEYHKKQIDAQYRMAMLISQRSSRHGMAVLETVAEDSEEERSFTGRVMSRV